MTKNKNWLGFLVLIYSLTLCFMIAAVLVTGYALSHPALGLIEGNPAIRSLVSKYALIEGLLLGFLQNVLLFFFFWLPFSIYIKFAKEYRYKIYGDSIAYSWMSGYGLSAFVFFFLDVINDIYCVTFGVPHSAIFSTLKSWNTLLSAVIFFFPLLVAYYLTTRFDKP